MKTLELNQMEIIEGGVTKEQYCDTLGGMLLTGGYQGDEAWGWALFGHYC